MIQRPIFSRVFWTLFVLLGLACTASGAEKELPPGSALPQFTIPAPNSDEVSNYLGLADKKAFTLSQVPANLTVVEFFSVTCPVCHRQAPRANRIFDFITKDDALGKDVKMLGVGLGNKDNQISVYARSFNVPFPLFGDPNKEIQKKLKVEHIPLTVVIDKKGKVLTSHLGVIKDLDGFFRELRELHKNQ